MAIKYFQVDAFTSKPFSGNAAGVCLLDEKITDGLMQQIAGQLNVSETAFLNQENDKLYLRWFTPTVEIALCGHATLATAHILWENKLLDPAAGISFHTKSGALQVYKKDQWIQMRFPAFYSKPAEISMELIKLLDIMPIHTAEVFDRYLIELSSEAEVRTIDPDFSKLKLFKKVLVTSIADNGSEFDFISRYFAPGIGVNEDPVTGTAHCCLATYWAPKLKKTSMIAFQASKRGGTVKMDLEESTVLLSGQAITVVRGSLTV